MLSTKYHLDAEKYLFALKEILTTEQQTQTEFLLQIFWGLLSCEILLQREKETLEFTTLKKMKEFIEKLLTDQVHSYQENMNHKAWILHQVLVYSFTNTSKGNSVSLFGQILADKSPLGQGHLNILQIKCQYLIRYLVSSLLLSGNSEALSDTVLSVAQSEKSKYTDSFTQFVEALYERFDFPAALALAKEIGKAAADDLLLKGYAAELQAQATLLVYQVKAKLYKSLDLKEVVKDGAFKTEEEARARIEDSLKREGFGVEVAGSLLKVAGQLKDSKAKLYNKTADLVKRTNQLFAHY